MSHGLRVMRGESSEVEGGVVERDRHAVFGIAIEGDGCDGVGFSASTVDAGSSPPSSSCRRCTAPVT